MSETEELARAVGQAVRIARVRRGWSQERLGTLAGTDGPHISQIERGLRNPAISTVARIAWALGMTLTQLMAAADEERPQLPEQRSSDLKPEDDGEAGGTS